MDIAKVFDVAAQDYDATRKKYIACFDDFYGVAIEQIPFSSNVSFRLLDLGAGTGLFSALVTELFPNCEITLTDISGEMLEKAQQRFSDYDNANFVKHDYINEDIPGKYDIVISALSLHHSTENELESVFHKIFNSLDEGGVFINADQILGRTVELEKAYEAAWLTQAKAKGCTRSEIKTAIKRMESDKTLPLSVQLNALADAGFKNANCWYQYYRYAVYSGVKCT